MARLRVLRHAIMATCLVALAIIGIQINHDSTGLVSANIVSHSANLHARAVESKPTQTNTDKNNGGNKNNNNTNAKNDTHSNNGTEVGPDDAPSQLKMIKPVFSYNGKAPSVFLVGDTIYFEWVYDEETLKIKPQNVTIELCRNFKDYYVLDTIKGYQNPTKYVWDTSKWDMNKAGFPLSSSDYQLYIYDERGRNNGTDGAGRLSTYVANMRFYVSTASCTECNSASGIIFSAALTVTISALASALVYLL